MHNNTKRLKPNIRTWEKGWKQYNQAPYFKPNLTLLKQIHALFPTLRNKKILELGAGSGSDIVSLAQQGAIGYALDFSPESLRSIYYWAKQKKVHLFIKRGNIEKLDYPAHSFDCVYSVGLMEHFHNLLPLLRQQIRLVKKGGYLIIDVPQTYTMYTIMKHIRMRRNTHPFGWETQYSASDLQKIAQQLQQTKYTIYGRDLDIVSHLPECIAEKINFLYKKYVEPTQISWYTSLCIGIIIHIQ